MCKEDRYDFVKDILVRYKGMKRIYGYKMNEYWSNISTVEAYYETNMSFLQPEIRDYFFKQYRMFILRWMIYHRQNTIREQ